MMTSMLLSAALSVASLPNGAPQLFGGNDPLIIEQRAAVSPTPPVPPCGAAALPDLVVDSARIAIPGFTGGCLSDGIPVSLALHVCIRNQGNAAAGAFDVEVNERFFARVAGLDPGDTVCALGSSTYPDDTRAVLDSGHEVAECNEDNNVWTRFVPIPTRPPTCRTPSPTPTVPPIVVSGVVYDAMIGLDAPIADAEVRYTYGNGGGGSVRTDTAGRYQFGLAADVSEFELIISADGFFVSGTGHAVAELGQPLDIGLDRNGCASASAISIVPDTGPPGTAVDVSGQCYFIHSGRRGTIYFDAQPIVSVNGDTGGGYRTTFTVPLTASAGPHLVSLRGSGEYGVVTFNVLPLCTGECACIGDCNGDGAVRVEEVVRMVIAALDGNGAADACPDIARWCAGPAVDISCLVGAVDSALQGCP